MTGSLFVTLALAAASVGTLHALAPDHWVPIAAVARARGWSQGRTARVALLCGFGHVTVSAVLGLLALVSGVKALEALGARLASVAWVLMIGFGLAVTMGTMLGMVLLARAGAGVLRGRWLERYGDSAAGGMIVVTGIAVALLGW